MNNKGEIFNARFGNPDDHGIIVDPKGEYGPCMEAWGGRSFELAVDSPHHINPMDIDLSFDEENPMALKADFILSLMELIVGGKDGLQPVERTVIDRCVRQMYREHLQNPETAEMPTLQTLYDLLCAQPEAKRCGWRPPLNLCVRLPQRVQPQDQRGLEPPSGMPGLKEAGGGLAHHRHAHYAGPCQFAGVLKLPAGDRHMVLL